MMECKEVMRRLEGLIPPACASDWDNVGLLAGDPKKKVDKILVALDASDQVLDQAEAVGADMLLTHHPLIFSPVKNVREDDFIGWRIRRMIRMDLSYYAMHTNYDVCRMGEQAAARMGLDLSTVTFLAQEKPFIYEGKPAGFGAVGDLETPMSLGGHLSWFRQKLWQGSTCRRSGCVCDRRCGLSFRHRYGSPGDGGHRRRTLWHRAYFYRGYAPAGRMAAGRRGAGGGYACAASVHGYLSEKSGVFDVEWIGGRESVSFCKAGR